MKTGPVIPDPVAERHDDLVTYRVKSESRPGQVHLVNLNDYEGSGSCSCEWFTRALEPILRRMVTPEEALATGKVRLTCLGQRDADALRCKHLIAARHQFTDDVLARILRDHKANAKPENPY